MRFGPATLALLWAVLWPIGGCPKQGRSSAAGDADDDRPVWVPIDLSAEGEELDELDGIELKHVTAGCGNYLDLEPIARLGRLTEGQIGCMSNALGEAQRQTARDKISRVLLADAWAKGDLHRWMGYASQHLETIERSDPDLIYQFVYHLVEIGNVERMDEAIHWCEVALENKAAWEGDLHVRRVYGLYRVRTMAALKKWLYLEARYRSTPSDDLYEQVEESRNQLKTYAREWFDYAKSAGRDTADSLRVCAMAAGTVEFCMRDG